MDQTKPSVSVWKLAGPGLVVAATGIGSGDVVSATVAIACELVLFTAIGFGPLLWSPRTLPVWIAAPRSSSPW